MSAELTVQCDVETHMYHTVTRCTQPAVTRIGYDTTACNQGDKAMPVVNHCAVDTDWVMSNVGADSAFLGCGCKVLEIVSLVRTDPGPEYADMLRSL